MLERGSIRKCITFEGGEIMSKLKLITRGMLLVILVFIVYFAPIAMAGTDETIGLPAPKIEDKGHHKTTKGYAKLVEITDADGIKKVEIPSAGRENTKLPVYYDPPGEWSDPGSYTKTYNEPYPTKVTIYVLYRDKTKPIKFTVKATDGSDLVKEEVIENDAVGGVWIPISSYVLLAPYIGWAAAVGAITIVAVAVSLVYARKRRFEKTAA